MEAELAAPIGSMTSEVVQPASSASMHSNAIRRIMFRFPTPFPKRAGNHSRHNPRPKGSSAQLPHVFAEHS
jgi:hypothetical protein